MISAETAVLTTNQYLEDHFDHCVLSACESLKKYVYISGENMPTWLVEKIENQGFSIEEAGPSYRISWGNND